IGLNGASLLPGGLCTITVNVTSSSPGSYVNTTGNVSSSNAGAGNTASATLVVGLPKLGLAKALDRIFHSNSASDNDYTLVYRLTAENLGDVPLSNLELFDDVVTQFAGLNPRDFNVWVTNSTASLTPAATLPLNASWNGTATSNLTQASQSLAVGESKHLYVSFVVTVNPFAALPDNTLRDNSATVRATGPGSSLVTDTSTNGLNPDPNNDNNPTETTVTPVAFVKLIKEVANCGTGLSVCTGSYGTTAIGKPGDYLEYRIRYFNISSQTISTLVVNDTLAAATPFQEDAYPVVSPTADFRVTCPNSSTVDMDRSNTALTTTPTTGAITTFTMNITAASICNVTTLAPGGQGHVLFKVRIP
ncbi:MAG: hypothetical protein ACRCYY_09920, partial [Trueperaceae bacterium]